MKPDAAVVRGDSKLTFFTSVEVWQAEIKREYKRDTGVKCQAGVGVAITKARGQRPIASELSEHPFDVENFVVAGVFSEPSPAEPELGSDGFAVFVV